MKTPKIMRVPAILLAVIMLFCAAGCNSGTTTSEYWEEEIIVSGGEIINESTNSTESNASNNEGQTNVSSNTTSVGGTTDPGTNSGDNPGPNTGNEGSTTDGFDLKGKTVLIGGWGAGEAPSKTSSTYKEEMQLIADIEKKYNCKIDFVQATESMKLFETWSTNTLAGTRYCDIIKMASDQFFPQAALKGFLTQLDGLVDLNNSCWIQNAFEATELKGKHYYVAPVTRAISLAGDGIGFNKEIFSKFGLKSPYDYVKEGNWNWDTFRQLAIDATRVEGGVQYYGYGSSSPRWFIPTNGASTSYMQGEKAVFGLDTQAAIDAIDFLRKLYNTDGVIPKGSTTGATFANGRIAMITSHAYDNPSRISSLGSNYGYTYMPHGPAVNDYQYHGASVNLYGVTSLAIDPAACAAIMEEYYGTYKWRVTLEERIEAYAPDETAHAALVDCVQRAMSEVKLEGYYSWYTREVIWGAMGVTSNTAARVYIDSIKAKSQESIDSIWNLLDEFK